MVKLSRRVLLLLTILCLSIGVVFAASPIPVVEEITGPTEVNLNDEQLEYTYSATVSGGQAPYTYHWEARGTLIKEGDFPSITIGVDDMSRASNGAGYWVYLTVTDANGKMANYIEAGEVETLFVYGIVGDALMIHPNTFPYPMMIDGDEVIPDDTTEPETPEPVPNDSGVRFSGINGQVEYLPPGATEWEFADLDTVLVEGAHIRTESESSCVLSFTDMSTFVLKAESEVVVSTIGEKVSKIDILTGNIWTNVKKMANDGSFSIKMNQAIAGAKGTTFVCIQEGDFSMLLVIEGTVDFKNTVSGNVETVTGGETVHVNAGETSDVSSFDIQWEQDKWDPYIEQYNIEVSEGLEILASGDDGSSDTGASGESETQDGGSQSSMIPGVPLVSAVIGLVSYALIRRRNLL